MIPAPFRTNPPCSSARLSGPRRSGRGTSQGVVRAVLSVTRSAPKPYPEAEAGRRRVGPQPTPALALRLRSSRGPRVVLSSPQLIQLARPRRRRMRVVVDVEHSRHPPFACAIGCAPPCLRGRSDVMLPARDLRAAPAISAKHSSFPCMIPWGRCRSTTLPSSAVHVSRAAPSAGSSHVPHSCTGSIGAEHPRRPLMVADTRRFRKDEHRLVAVEALQRPDHRSNASQARAAARSSLDHEIVVPLGTSGPVFSSHPHRRLLRPPWQLSSEPRGPDRSRSNHRPTPRSTAAAVTSFGPISRTCSGHVGP